MRDRLIEKLSIMEEMVVDPKANFKITDVQRIIRQAREMLEKAIIPPCKVGDTVWDTEGNAWKVFAITIWQDCIGLKTANNRGVRKTFTIGKHSIGKTVFLTKEEAEKALKGGVQE